MTVRHLSKRLRFVVATMIASIIAIAMSLTYKSEHLSNLIQASKKVVNIPDRAVDVTWIDDNRVLALALGRDSAWFEIGDYSGNWNVVKMTPSIAAWISSMPSSGFNLRESLSPSGDWFICVSPHEVRCFNMSGTAWFTRPIPTSANSSDYRPVWVHGDTTWLDMWLSTG